MPSSAAPSKKKLAAVVGWLIHVAAARGVQVEADADQLERVGLTRIVQHVVVRSMGRGASVLLEVVARVILFLLALLLSWSPSTRAMAMHRVASHLRRHADQLQRLGAPASIETCEPVDCKRPAGGAGEHKSEGARRAEPPRVLVLGDRGVGGNAVIQALRALAAAEGVELPVERGLRRRPATDFYSEVALALIVWEASIQRSLSDYAAHHSEQLRSCVGQHVPAIVVCNKTDTMPCPLPQIEGLGDSCPFIAVSAEKQINLRHLWEMVRPTLPRPPATACAAPLGAVRSTAGIVEMETPSTGTHVSPRAVSSPVTPAMAAAKGLVRRRQ